MASQAELKPALMMVTSQVALSAVNILYKLAKNNGFSLAVLITYRLAFAALTVAPLALIFERNRPRLTWNIAFQAFICGLLGGSMAQNINAESLVLTSATFATAMTNLIPAMTFILAVFFRLERLALNSIGGKAKIMGTLACIAGAMLLTFYEGVEVKIWSTHFDLMNMFPNPSHEHVAGPYQKHSNNIVGLLLAFVSCVLLSTSLILQAKMSRAYPYPYSSTTLISFMGSLQAAIFALCKESDWTQWKLGFNIRLFSAAYMGIVASGLVTVVFMYCVSIKGPLYLSIFNPLMLVLVAVEASLLLDEKLYVGSILGAGIIIFGLYAVLWGKAREIPKEIDNGAATKNDDSNNGDTEV